MKSCTQKVCKSRQQKEGFSQKKLELLLPSSKQLLLINSSIKYNCLREQNQDNQSAETQSFAKNEEDRRRKGKENSFYHTRTSILKIEELPQGREEGLGETLAEMKEKSLNILANSYKKLSQTAANNSKSFSSTLPHYNPQTNQLTSITNIVQEEPQPSSKLQSKQKKELLQRISKLQNLVYDIIRGKVPISRHQSQKKIKQNRKESTRDHRGKAQRSFTDWKDTQVKSMKSSKKVRIENPLQCRRDDMQLKPLRGFLLKKKTLLKLDNYKPIRDIEERQRSILRKNTLGEQTERPKLKLRVNFMPNIINL